MYLELTMSQAVLVLMVIHQGKLPHTQRLFHCIQEGVPIDRKRIVPLIELVIFCKVSLLSDVPFTSQVIPSLLKC